MSRISAVFTGNVVAEPTKKDVNGTSLLEFPVYVNHTKKDRDSGEYVKTGDTSKIRVTVWRDLANSLDVKQGDLVEVHGSLIEKEFQKQDGTTGRSLPACGSPAFSGPVRPARCAGRKSRRRQR